MGRIYVGDGKAYVWQWQPKEQIVLEGYPDGVFVRYANCDTVEAPVVQTRHEGDRLIADIPPELMQVDKDITVYVCNEDGIIHCHFLSVIGSPKPASYVYEPVEVLRYESLAERVKKLEEDGTGGGSCDCGDPYIASDEPPEDTDALWINTSEPKEAVALGVTAVETVEGVEFYATDELGTTKGLVRHGKDGAPGEKGDPGEPGRTPAKGEDYFTPSEIEDVARQAAEMVEVPEGGGGVEFSYFIATIDEDATYFTVTEDAEGTPLKFTEAYISVTAARSAEATTNGAMGVGLTEWLNSFNSKAIFYNMSLMADAYRYMLHVKTDGGMLTARMMGDIRCAANIGAAKPMLTAESGAQMGYSAMQHTTSQSARFTPASLAIAYGNIYNGETAENPMVIDGAMHTVTIGVDTANAVKIGAGSFVEVWYR